MEKWVLKNKKADFNQIVKEHKVSEVIARLLANRDVIESDDIHKFLNSSLDNLHDPKNMKDIHKASQIISYKIRSHDKIRIVGDYDVDGVASTYILYSALLKCGANVDYEIPDRIKDGYGININIIEEAQEAGIDTIITCDNGIAAIEQVKRAKELGITIIITDHHDIPYVLMNGEKEYLVPDANAVVNPKQEECNYPFSGLCGAVVAFKFVQVLYEEFNIPIVEIDSLLEIAAIATICDVMDLVDENRIIVKYGLKLLRNTSNLGIRALLEINNIPLTKLSTYHIGFIIGPCLNASGRLDTAKKGLRLLLSKTKAEADTLASELKTLNDVRKEMTLKGFEKALLVMDENQMHDDKILVVYIDNCHESLAGIIAGRLKEKFNKPAIVLTDSENGVKGSCRSIPQYNIYEELTKCKDLLMKYGGHPMAAGLSLSYDNVDILRKMLNENTTLTKEDLLAKVVIDVILPFGYVSVGLIEELELLEPFGKGNTKPVFAEKNVKVLKANLLGKDKNVLKLRVVNEYNKEMEAMYFGNTMEIINEMKALYGENEVNKMFINRDNDVRLSITYYPSINEYGGKLNTQIIIQNYQLIVKN